MGKEENIDWKGLFSYRLGVINSKAAEASYTKGNILPKYHYNYTKILNILMQINMSQSITSNNKKIAIGLVLKAFINLLILPQKNEV